MDKFMEIEAARKTGAEKGIHAENCIDYIIWRIDTRLEIVYLSVSKL